MKRALFSRLNFTKVFIINFVSILYLKLFGEGGVKFTKHVGGEAQDTEVW
jgi:hypothetical protein